MSAKLKHDNRRQWPRGASRLSRLTLWTNDTVCQEAQVLDESLTGVALLVGDGTACCLGQEVRLTHGDRGLSATVRRIQPEGEGKWRLGLEWGPCEVKPASLLLLLPERR
jgi:hypothetical protein